MPLHRGLPTVLMIKRS